MDNIDIFNNSEIILKRKSFKIKYYILTMFFLLTIFLLFAFLYKYNSYLNLQAIIQKDNNKYYLKTFIKDNDISSINNKNLIVNNQKYQYKITKISDEYILDEKYNKYYEVLIDTKINSKYYIENNIIDISIELPKTTLIKQLVTKIKKGLR